MKFYTLANLKEAKEVKEFVISKRDYVQTEFSKYLSELNNNKQFKIKD